MSLAREIAVEATRELATPSPLLGAGLLATVIVGVPLARAALRLSGTPPFRVDPPWSFAHAAALLFAALLAMTVVGLLADDPGPLAGMYLTELVLLVPVCVAVLVALPSSARGFEALGLRKSGNARAMLAGCLAFLALLPALNGAALLWPTIVGWFGQEVPVQDVMLGILGLEGIGLVQAAILAVLVQPLFEEMIFRGFLQPLLVAAMGTVGGIVATAVLFGLLHGIVFSPPLAAFGLLLGVIQHRTGRLSAAWAAHGLHNAITLGIAFAIIGAESASG